MDSFQVGSVLGMSFRAFARNLIPFLAISAFFYVPALLYVMNWIQAVENQGDSGGTFQFTFIFAVFTLLASSFVTASLTYTVVNDMHGQRAGISAVARRGIESLWPTFGVAIIGSLALIGGLLLLIVPGIIVACMLYVAVPAVVIERTGAMNALRRSRELTQGHKGKVFGLLLMVGLTEYFVSKLISAAFPIKTALYVQVGVEAIFAPMAAVVAAVTYCALRAEKDGPRMSHLGTAFE